MIVLIVSVLLLAALAMSVPEQGGNALDRSTEAWMSSLKSDGMTAMFKLFSQLGSTLAIIGITLVAALVVGWMRGWLRGASIIAGVAAAYLLNSCSKCGLTVQDRLLHGESKLTGQAFPAPMRCSLSRCMVC